ncbi:MAG TPA: glycosyltransferase family 4 protein [Burkholderiales bacterium]|nr:glycosyltransferase family 4 protein [Burkholderiales bacterium]
MPPIRTLHVDVEGGWGGSSRSLFELVSRLPRDRFAPAVVHRQRGPVEQRYAAIGIETVHVPELGTYVPRRNGALRNLAAKLPELLPARNAARRLCGIADRFGSQIVHLNHEGLFLVGNLLKSRQRRPIVVHCRASGVAENAIGRWFAGSIARAADHVFFISPNEERWFRRASRAAKVPGEVMWNIASAPRARQPLPETPEAVYLGNIDRSKGVDRLFEIAKALDEMRAPPLRIAVFGAARNGGGFARSFLERAGAPALADRIVYRGHTTDPEAVLAGAFALLRVSRTNDPWGRDVIEAARNGVPVLATGSYDGVVRPGVTGFLFPAFDAGQVALRLAELARDPGQWGRMSAAAAAFAEEQFGGGRQVHQFEAAVRRLTLATDRN